MYRYPYTAETLHDQRSLHQEQYGHAGGLLPSERVRSARGRATAQLLSPIRPLPMWTLLSRRSHSDTCLPCPPAGLERGQFYSQYGGQSRLGSMDAESPGCRRAGHTFSTTAAGVQTCWRQSLKRRPGKRWRIMLSPALRPSASPISSGIANRRTHAGGFGLHMTPRDMAKLGYLYLHQGQWDGAQIVPAEWVTAATSPQAPVNPEDDFNYGYQWWLPAKNDPLVYFAARGTAASRFSYYQPRYGRVMSRNHRF